ncbi:MAG: peptide chain release factor 1 [Candidatus Delongbacteria bacterium]|nr:peptide chain release factor 1 [Candidatus Delongbacteria bacterium]
MLEKLLEIEDKYRQIEELLNQPDIYNNQERFRELSKQRSSLNDIFQLIKVYKTTMAQIEEDRQLIDQGGDHELIGLARSELEVLLDEKQTLEQRIRILLLPQDPNDEKNIIIEIRAGTGGEEAALFAGDLFRMYSRYVERRKWKKEIMDANPTGIGGFKEMIFSITGDRVYSKMKFESGVHRVQRIPQTESGGRVHTSAATVAVLPEADEIDVQIDSKDIKIDVYRSTGCGGQHVNTTDSAVRITHLPSGIVVQCQDEKSQLKNKAKAMKVLRARLMDKTLSDQHAKTAQERKTMVGSGDRSEKIRTYNFPQNRMTDHRINFTSYRLDEMLDGEIDDLIDALIFAEQTEQLKQI